MTSLPAIPSPASPPNPADSAQNSADFSVAAALLLPAPQGARSQLDVAIRLLTGLAQQPPAHVPESYIATAAKVRRMLAEIRRQPVHR